MSLELIYTSAARGLRPNSSGFCTVAISGGMSKVVANALEGMSAYDFHYKLSDPKASRNPPNFAHTVARLGGRRHSVLSRVGFCGADFSGRANKIAHHVVLSEEERLPLGPAEMMLQMRGQIFCEHYTDPPKELPPRALSRELSHSPVASGPARTWQQLTGDAGWAGVLTEAFVEKPQTPSYIIYQPGEDILRLMAESLALLPPQKRWEVSFVTYYVSMPAGCFYHWRGVVAGSRAAAEVRRFPNATVIDLTKSLSAAADSPYSAASRQGQQLAVASLVEVSAPTQSPAEVVPQAGPPTARLVEPAAAIPAGALASLTNGPVRPRAAARPNIQAPVADKSPVFFILTIVLALTNIITLALWLNARKTSTPMVAVREELADAGETSPVDSADDARTSQPDGADSDAGPTEPPGPTSPDDSSSEDGPGSQQDADSGVGDTDSDAGPTDPPGPDSPDNDGDGGLADAMSVDSPDASDDPAQPHPLTHERVHDETPDSGPRWELEGPPSVSRIDGGVLGQGYDAYQYEVAGASAFVAVPEKLAGRLRIVPDENDAGLAVVQVQAKEGGDWTDTDDITAIAECRLADGELTVTPKDDPKETGLDLLVIEVAGDKGNLPLYQCRLFPTIQHGFAFGFGPNGKVKLPEDRENITSVKDYVSEADLGRPELRWDLDFAGNVPPNKLRDDLCEWLGATSLSFAMPGGEEAFVLELSFEVMETEVMERSTETDLRAAYVAVECDRLKTIASRARSLAVSMALLAVMEKQQIAGVEKGAAERELASAETRVGQLSPAEGAQEDAGGELDEAAQKKLNDAIAALEAARADLAAVEARETLLHEHESALTNHADFDRDLEPNVEAALRKELKAIRQAVVSASPVTIVDPWGMPVLQVQLVFEIPAKEGEDVIDTIGQRSALRDVNGDSQ